MTPYTESDEIRPMLSALLLSYLIVKTHYKILLRCHHNYESEYASNNYALFRYH